MSLDVRTNEKDRSNGWISVFCALETWYQNADLCPSNEELCYGPPRVIFRGETALFRVVLETSKDRRCCPAQVT